MANILSGNILILLPWRYNSSKEGRPQNEHEYSTAILRFCKFNKVKACNPEKAFACIVLIGFCEMFRSKRDCIPAKFPLYKIEMLLFERFNTTNDFSLRKALSLGGNCLNLLNEISRA